MGETSLPNPNPSDSTAEATVVSNAPQCSDSSVKNDAGASSGGETSLQLADDLILKGTKASKEGDYAEATDCFSRALEIRVGHYGELSPECVNAYYKYGCALLYKAQEESDPLGSMPKKDAQSLQDSSKDGSLKNIVNDESSVASASSTVEQGVSSNPEGSAVENAPDEKDEGDEGEGTDTDDVGEGDEDESDLDLAWKMLDLARAIAEKNPSDTLDKVDILSTLAEVALEREDLETSLSDYHKALTMLERLVEPDDRYIAELNFRICLCLEVGSKASEAIPYCQKAISVCKSRMQRLVEEVKNVPEVADQGGNLPSNGVGSGNVASDKEAEIATLSNLLGELEKKLEDLQQLVMNPSSILSDILGLVSAKARAGAQAAPAHAVSSSRIGTAQSEGDFDSPTLSTGHTNGAAGVTNLGVVGRGVKRVNTTTGDADSSTAKKPALDPSNDQGGSSAP